MWLDGSSRCPREERFAFAVLHQAPLTPNGLLNCHQRKCGHYGVMTSPTTRAKKEVDLDTTIIDHTFHGDQSVIKQRKE